jgi:hypothetical protein
MNILDSVKTLLHGLGISSTSTNPTTQVQQQTALPPVDSHPMDTESNHADNMDLSDDPSSSSEAGSNHVRQVFDKTPTTDDASLSLPEMLVSLYLAAHRIGQEKSQPLLQKVEDARAKQQLISRLQELLIGAARSSNGDLDITSDREIQQLLQNASNVGISVNPKKFLYSRVEYDALQRVLERASSAVKTQLQLEMEAVKKVSDQWGEIVKLAQQLIREYSAAANSVARNIGPRH